MIYSITEGQQAEEYKLKKKQKKNRISNKR